MKMKNNKKISIPKGWKSLQEQINKMNESKLNESKLNESKSISPALCPLGGGRSFYFTIEKTSR